MAAVILLCVCYFLSGFAALTYEVVWTRELIRSLGASLYAVSTITALLLGGLALGAKLGGSILNRRFQDISLPTALKVFAALEVLTALFGVLIPFAFRQEFQQSLWQSFGLTDPAVSYVVRILYAMILILPPTICMGATLPVLVAAGGKQATTAAEWLYAANTLGGTKGAAYAGFILLPSLGLQNSSLIGALVNVVAAIGAFVMAQKSMVPDFKPLPAPARGAIVSKVSLSTVAMAAGLTGFCALLFQVCWTRLFSLVLGSSMYSMSTVLTYCLFGMATGAFLVSIFLLKYRQPLILAASALFFCAAYATTSLYLSDELPWSFIAVAQSMLSIFPGDPFTAELAARVLVVGCVVFVPSVLMGMVLPLLFAAVESDGTAQARFVGSVYAANTLGCIIGAAFTGFLLIPVLAQVTLSGIQTTLLLGAALQVAIGTWLFVDWSKTFIVDGETRMLTIGILGFVILAVVADIAIFRPTWNAAVMSSGASFYAPADLKKLDRETFLASLGVITADSKLNPVKYYREGLNSTITVEESHRINVTFLKSDGKVEAALPTDPFKPAPTSDIKTHVALGSLPVLLHEGKCSRVLVIGYGSGTTSGAVLGFPEVTDLSIAELEPAVFHANGFFQAANGQPLRQSWLDTRVHPILNDGRYVLSTLPNKLDAIVCQPSDPWVTGSSELFTKQFWQLGRSRLAPGGTFSQWIQLYSISPDYFGVLCRTFSSVFPDCALYHQEGAGECILIGFNREQAQSATPPPAEAFVHPVQAAVSLQESNADYQSALALDSSGVRRLCDSIGASTGDVRLNTDDNLLVEFAAARNALTQHQLIDENVNWINRAKH